MLETKLSRLARVWPEPLQLWRSFAHPGSRAVLLPLGSSIASGMVFTNSRIVSDFPPRFGEFRGKLFVLL
jgi:hypothetical protein